VLAKGESDAPWPTREQLKDQAKAVKEAKKAAKDAEEDVVGAASTDISKAILKLERAQARVKASLEAAAAVIADDSGGEEEAEGEEEASPVAELRTEINNITRQLDESALDQVVTAGRRAKEMMEAMAPPSELPPLAAQGQTDGSDESGEESGGEGEEAEEDGGAGEDGEDGDGETSSMPTNTKELRLAIANEDFGVSTDRSSTLASPAMKAYNKLAADKEKVKHARGHPLPDAFVIVETLPGLSGELCSRFHLVSALTRMRLIASQATSAPFKSHNKLREILPTTALIARRHVASHLTEDTIVALRRPLNPDKPNFHLMQQLYNAGIGKCPVSGMPVFNPSVCSPGLQRAIWRAYCGVASSANTKKLGQTDAALDELKAQLREHTKGSP